MAGDTLSASTYVWYNTPAVQPTSDPSLLNTLTNIFATSVAGIGGEYLSSQAPSLSTAAIEGITSLLNNQSGYNINAPKAFLNWALLDEQFNYVTGGVTQCPVIASGQNKQVLIANLPTTVQKSGYLYVYVSNESPQNVFFDKLTVQHNSGPLQEETHYYPFGLTMSGISSKAAGSLENRKKFNDGTELNTDLDVNWYETDYRSYDPQIGRFHQIDELTEFDFAWSPYVYAHNNPILLNDPLGLTADSTGKPGFTPGKPNVLPEVVVTSSNKKKSVGQPGTLESIIPIWGSGRAAVDDFQNGRWGWGLFNAALAVSDVFLIKSAFTAVGKIVAKEGVYVITTRSGRYIGQTKNFIKRLAQHFGKGGKLSQETLEKVLLHEMPGSTKLEREVYEQYLITNAGGPKGGELLNAVNPMGGRMEQYSNMIEGVIKKFDLPK